MRRKEKLRTGWRVSREGCLPLLGLSITSGASRKANKQIPKDPDSHLRVKEQNPTVAQITQFMDSNLQLGESRPTLPPAPLRKQEKAIPLKPLLGAGREGTGRRLLPGPGLLFPEHDHQQGTGHTVQCHGKT